MFTAALNSNEFLARGMDYVNENQNKIGTDVGYILSIIMMLISKWMRFDIKKKYISCIPPVPDQLKHEEETNNAFSMSQEDSFIVSKKLLIVINSIDYNSIRISLNNSLQSKVLPSYYMMVKH